MPAGQEATVLVVEDNVMNQVAIRALLERCGVRADFVASGAQAIAAVEAKRYHLILMDLMMPGMDGFAATRHIRRLEYGTGRHTPIIAVTAVDPQLCREASIVTGMNGLLSKPIDPEALAGVLQKWLPAPARAVSGGDGAAHSDRILESFLEVTAELLEDLNEAIESEDPRTASHLAHEVKASSLVISAGEMAKLARRLEQAIREEKWGEVVDNYRDLVAAFRRTTEELRRPVQAVLEKRIGRFVPQRLLQDKPAQ